MLYDQHSWQLAPATNRIATLPHTQQAKDCKLDYVFVCSWLRHQLAAAIEFPLCTATGLHREWLWRLCCEPAPYQVFYDYSLTQQPLFLQQILQQLWAYLFPSAFFLAVDAVNLHQHFSLDPAGGLMLPGLAPGCTQAVDLVDEDGGGGHGTGHLEQASHHSLTLTPANQG